MKNILKYKKPIALFVIMSLVALTIVLIVFFANPINRNLTEKEISIVNQVFEDSNNSYLEYLQTANSENLNPLVFFLHSYYEKPEEMDLNRFVYYLPREYNLTNEDQLEYDKLSNEFNLMNDNVENLVTAIGRISYSTVENYLFDYMNIHLNDMTNMGDAIYSDEYSAFYSRSSDVRTIDFVCTKGSKNGNIITVGNDFETLTLKKVGEKYYIVSFLPVEK